MTETLRDLRTRNHLTQKALADMSHDVTRHAVLRMEQHVYPTPLPSVITALGEISGIDEAVLVNMYMNEVHKNRRVSGELWDLRNISIYSLIHDFGNLHPFRGWRMMQAQLIGERDSAIQFCMAFSIHPYVLSEYENFRITYPNQISTALTEAGLPDNITEVIATEARFNTVYS